MYTIEEIGIMIHVVYMLLISLFQIIIPTVIFKRTFMSMYTVEVLLFYATEFQ